MAKYLIFILAILSIFSSCANHEPELVNNGHSRLPNPTITERQAIKLANRVTSHKVPNTQNIDFSEIDCTPILSDKARTRGAESIPDTLAFLINYPNNAGFAIVSAHDFVYPLLAYSDSGNFSFDNEIATTNFIDLLEPYIETAPRTKRYELSESFIDGTPTAKEPIISIMLDQRAPFDKYVIEEHPGCPVGCVAVATAYCMMYRRAYLTYHNEKIWFISIINAFKKHENSDFKPAVTLQGQPEYSYETAINYIARLLYWIGKDVNMIYNPEESNALSSDAYTLLGSLSYNIPSGWCSFNENHVAEYLQSNNLIFVRGRDYARNKGHAWVMDGYNSITNPKDETEIQDFYYHCNWGWGGWCNGYFSGKVFSVNSLYLYSQDYFAVKYTTEINGVVGPFMPPEIDPFRPTLP